MSTGNSHTHLFLLCHQTCTHTHLSFSFEACDQMILSSLLMAEVLQRRSVQSSVFCSVSLSVCLYQCVASMPRHFTNLSNLSFFYVSLYRWLTLSLSLSPSPRTIVPLLFSSFLVLSFFLHCRKHRAKEIDTFAHWQKHNRYRESVSLVRSLR